eukprot:TRINITY_DN22008_c0_g1_i1.p1 TRINITY_DN22008_c0_g1~~TRINITY_DN22008_c0_g1_i1.p1  ORF type:complete len:961 (-),score=277.25 TRINITY_DN22008_c0_g1_i1:346-3228(-)
MAPEMENAGELTDKRTVFVRNIAFPTTKEKLEETFGAVGPVRQCFLVHKKGEEHHSGIGFVQFALADDAEAAVTQLAELKVDGRKLKLEIARKRAPFEDRKRGLRASRAEKEGQEEPAVEIEEPTLDSSTTKPAAKKALKESKPPPDAATNGGTLTTPPDAALPVKQKREREREMGDGDAKETKPDSQEGDAGAQKEGKKAAKRAKKHGVPKEEEESVKQEGEPTKEATAEPPAKTPVGVVEMAPAAPSRKAAKAAKREEGKASEKQRPARTVVLGGLKGEEMRKEAVARARQVAATCEVATRLLNSAELEDHGLARDGCTADALQLVFPSVQKALQAVASLHGQQLPGGTLWARQLGGEGKSLRRQRLIVRNLPFQATETEVRALFASVAFVWEVSVPQSPAGRGRGFAFVGFTSSQDAQKAIIAVNGTVVGGRPIAVDWAAAKGKYLAAVADSEKGAQADAQLAEKSMDQLAKGKRPPPSSTEIDEGSLKKKARQTSKVEQPIPVAVAKKAPATNGHLVDVPAGVLDSDDEGDVLIEDADEESGEDNKGGEGPLREGDLYQRVLSRIMAGSTGDPPEGLDEADGSLAEDGNPAPKKRRKEEGREERVGKDDVTGRGEKGKKAGQSEAREGTTKGSEENRGWKEGKEAVRNKGVIDEGKEEGCTTVFVRPVGAEVTREGLQKVFSKFGALRACRVVLDPKTKRPKGTAFVEFRTASAALKAVEAAAEKPKGAGRTGAVGVAVQGRAVKVNLAVGQQEARQLAAQAGVKNSKGGKRNLHLAEEGTILEGSRAGRDMTASDQMKRERLRHEKATKLQSPKFVVSSTRLAVHNVPPGMTEGELRRMFMDTVRARATKQRPVITQVKILASGTGSKATKLPGGTPVASKARTGRGTAFVEFTEHQHALVALRGLNNHPEAFSADHRPIVEFAIENQMVHKQREGKRESAKKRGEEQRKGLAPV